MILPFPPRRSHLRAFWLALNLAAAVACSLAFVALQIPKSVPTMLAFLGAVAAAGLAWQDGPVWLYRAWNRVARSLGRMGQWWVLAVTYYLVLSATGRRGSRLDFAAPSGSMWKPFGFASNGVTHHNGAYGRGWLHSLLDQARAPERIWWLGVVPFLVLLSLFPRQAGSDEMPANTYTLF